VILTISARSLSGIGIWIELREDYGGLGRGITWFITAAFLSARRYAICCHRVSVRPSVCPSHACTVSVTTRRITQTSHDGPLGTIYYHVKDLYEIPTGSPPTGAPNAGGVGKNGVFRSAEKSPAQTLYRRKFVSIRHGGPRPRRCAGGGGSRRWLITITVHLTSRRLFVRKSVDDTHGIACSLCDRSS